MVREKYVVHVNGVKKVAKGSEIKLNLKKGANDVQVQAMNQAKRLGPASSATICFDSRYTDVKSFW
ncbi:MAG: hypothetical protein HUU57_07755 [Bdellovibrio sp.]|nr:hypothetical protein [Bdellovibrio sp.]